MKFASGFLIGIGVGAGAVNATVVPHGYNQGFFVGAVLTFIGAAVFIADLRKSRKMS